MEANRSLCVHNKSFYKFICPNKCFLILWKQYVDNASKHIFSASFHAFQVSTLENKVTALELVRHLGTLCCNGLNCTTYVSCFLSSFLTQAVQRVSCNSNPCQNGGSCLNLINSYHCLCPENWAVSSILFCHIMGLVITIGSLFVVWLI